MTNSTQEDYQDDYFAAYFGNDADYYLRKLEDYRNGKIFSFNIGAFFFGMLWMLYRKLYLVALLFLALAFSQGLALGYAQTQFQVPKETIVIIDRVLMLVWGFLAGFLGNYLYLRQAEVKVRQVQDAKLSPQETVNTLSLLGGTTYWPHISIAFIVLLATLVLKFG